MNVIVLLGRLCGDPELRYIPNSETAIGTFTLAVNRTFSKEKKADFIRIKAFGKTAENCEKYLSKGKMAGVKGRLQIDSYENKEGKMMYFTEVIAEQVDFVEPKDKKGDDSKYNIPNGFEEVDDDMDDFDESMPF